MRAAVLGSPVAHSLSPVLHRAAYARLGLDWTYDARRVHAGAAAGVRRRPGTGVGRPVPDHAAEDGRPAVAGRGRRRRAGHRRGQHAGPVGRPAGPPDGRQHRRARDSSPPSPRPACGRRRPGGAPAVVLGGGATARSAVVSLARSGWASVDLVVRRPEAAARRRLRGPGSGARASGCTPGTSRPCCVRGRPRRGLHRARPGPRTPSPPTSPTGPGCCSTSSTTPGRRRSSAAWAAAGGTVLGGLDLLVHQAALQVRLMTGCSEAADVLVEVMRPAGEAELSRRASSTAPDGRRRRRSAQGLTLHRRSTSRGRRGTGVPSWREEGA